MRQRKQLVNILSLLVAIMIPLVSWRPLKVLLKALDVYVVGAASENLQGEVITLKSQEGVPQAIICAVPYLRDRDIRKTEAKESLADKDQKLIAGIKSHYHEVCEHAKLEQSKLIAKHKLTHIPIIGMGHLFAAGGKTQQDDGCGNYMLAHLRILMPIYSLII